MAPQLPPPLPQLEPAWATYLKAFGTVFPALCIWLFSNLFLLPKLEWLWQHTNLTGSKAQWLLDLSRFLADSSKFVVWGIVLLIIVLEVRVPAWPRYRRAVISIIAVVFHTTVLLGLAAVATSVLLAAPLLTKTK